MATGEGSFQDGTAPFAGPSTGRTGWHACWVCCAVWIK